MTKKGEGDRKYCTMVIDGRTVLVDLDDFDIMPGDEAAVIRGDGSLAITELKPFKDYEEMGGPRWAIAASQAAGAYQACIIMGRVVAASF